MIDFDTSTAAGQLRLMAVSVGLDSEAFVPKPFPPVRTAAVAPAEVVANAHPLVGRTVRVTWKPFSDTLRSSTIGEVVAAEPVWGGLRHRLALVVARDPLVTLRCYTGDPDWVIEELDATPARLPHN